MIRFHGYPPYVTRYALSICIVFIAESICKCYVGISSFHKMTNRRASWFQLFHSLLKTARSCSIVQIFLFFAKNPSVDSESAFLRQIPKQSTSYSDRIRWEVQTYRRARDMQHTSLPPFWNAQRRIS